MEKIVLKLPHDAWHGHATETIWAEKVGQNRYRVRSVPFFAKNVSNEDIVLTHREEGVTIFDQVSIRGGHSTYRLFLAAANGLDGGDFKLLWRQLEQLGCTYERATERLLAVDVPTSNRLKQAYAILERGESSGVWEFEEGYAAI